MQFTLGQKVIWRSQAQGAWTEKEGEIVQVVPPGDLPDTAFTKLHQGAGIGRPRSEESYVVLVKKEGSKVVKHYWPRPSALNPV
jgi:hypothetical protein